MASIVVDSNVLVKWFLSDEEDVSAALAIRDRIKNELVQAVTPAHALLEVADSLRKAARQGRFSSEDVGPAVRSIDGFGLGTVLSVDSLVAATALAQRLGISVYDATFAQLAIDVNGPLVTADRRLYEQAVAGGIDALWLGDAPVSSDTVG
jgi:predicted nucleic acid-binding protein